MMMITVNNYVTEDAIVPDRPLIYLNPAKRLSREVKAMNKLITVVGCFFLVSPAIAGDCKIQNIEGRSVQTCDNGYVETTGRNGTRSYGIRNGGVDRYPGNSIPSWAIERRNR
jgi:hypothetical protein